MNAVEQPSVQSDQLLAARKAWATPTVITDSARSTRSLANNLGPDGTSSYFGSQYGS